MAFLKSAERHIKEGINHIQARDFEKALKSFQHAEKKKPENSNIKNYISQAYAGLENFDKANEYILKAIALEPESPTHKQLYSTYLMKQGKNLEAIPVIDEALKLQPIDIIYILRGQADYHMGNMESALIFFDKALELDKRNPLSNHMKGLVLYRLERFEDAIPFLEIALSFGEIESLRRILEDCRIRIKSG
jgi:tetratricopeptide (TPR) repeat protein